MAGYRRKGTIFELQFKDPEMEGLIVRVKKPSMGGKLDMVQFQDLAKLNTANMSSEDIDKLRAMFAFFARFLVSWNLEEEADGSPVPCNVDGLLSADDELVLAIINAWVDAIGTISAPLDETSNGGLPLAGLEIPMETLSPSLLNLPEPN